MPNKLDEAQALAHLESILTFVPFGFAFLDLDLRFLRVNQQFADLHGVSVAAHIGKTVAEIAATREPTLRAVAAQIVASGQPVLDREFTGETIRAPGTVRTWSESWYPVRGERDETIGFSVMVVDITERKYAEAAQRASERYHQAVAEASLEVPYRMSADWPTMMALDGRALVASSDAALANWAWLHQNLPHDEHARVKQGISDAIAGKRLFEMEHRVLRPDGSIGWTLSRAVPILDEHGSLVAWFGAASDISERKRTEEELRLLASIVENARDFIGIADIHGKPVYGNRVAMDMVGAKDLEQVRHRKITDYFIPEQRAFVDEVVLPAAAKEGRWSGELTMQHFVTGTTFPVWYDLFRWTTARQGSQSTTPP